MSSANINEESTAFDHPLPGIEGAPPGISNGNQIASNSFNDEGNNLADSFSNPPSNIGNLADNFQIDSLPLNNDLLFSNDESIDSGYELFANTEESAEITPSQNVFSEADPGNLVIDDGTIGLKEDLFASTERGAEGILPADSFSVADSDLSGGLGDISVFSKRGMMKARAG